MIGKKQGVIMSKVQILRYETRADAAEVNQGLIENIFAELNSADPGGLRNITLRLADGVTFVHIAVTEEGSETLAKSAAFAEFVKDHGGRITAPPTIQVGTVVGSYGFLD
jgi:hypothetical protein